MPHGIRSSGCRNGKRWRLPIVQNAVAQRSKEFRTASGNLTRPVLCELVASAAVTGTYRAGSLFRNDVLLNSSKIAGRIYARPPESNPTLNKPFSKRRIV